MRIKRVVYVVIAAIMAISSSWGSVYAFTNESNIDEDRYGITHISWYDGGCKGGGISGACGGDISAEGVEARLREVVKKYGEIAMKMQIEYGPPWELVFAQMVAESGVGSAENGINAGVAQNGYFNWLGLTFSNSHFYNLPEAFHSSNDRSWSQYASIGDMIAGWMVDYLRNGYYDDAYVHTDKNNYDIKQFFYKMIAHYCPESDGCNHDGYWSTVSWAIDIIHEVAAEQNWPTSAQLAKDENIAIGGKHPVNGDIHSQMNAAPHSLTADCTNDDDHLSDEDSNTKVDGSKVLLIGDSISVHSKNALKEKMPGLDYDAISGTWWSSDRGGTPGLTRLRQHDLRDVVIFAMGTNGGVTQKDVDDLIAITGTERKVIVMTQYNGDYPETTKARNRNLLSYIKKYNNIVVMDWYSAVMESPSKYMQSDNLHPNEEGQKLFANLAAKAVSKSNGDKTKVNITWKDGWITGGMDGYVKEDAIAADAAGTFTLEDSSHTGQFLTGKANKITLHYTAGGDQGGGGGLKLYGGGYPAHFTINLQRKEVFQHFSIDRPSDAVASHDNSAGVQIEIIGNGDNSLGEKWNLHNSEYYGKEEWIYLAKLLVGISQYSGMPLTGNVEWDNPPRMAVDEFRNYTGIAAHMHVPANDHTDTGDIWGLVSEALEAVEAGSGLDKCGKKKSRINGGLTEEQAQAIADYYKGNFDDEPYHLPSDMGKWNCVSFSAWFVQGFTDVGLVRRGWGNGKDVAHNLKRDYGWRTGSDPEPFSVFSVTQGKTECPDGSGIKCGHTGIVVAVDGDDITIIEAAYGSRNYTAVRHLNISYFYNKQYPNEVFAYMDEHLDKDKLEEFLGGK